MKQIKNVVIVSASRTPVGNFMGVFKDVAATKLGSHVIQSVINKSKINPQLVDEVIMGNVLPANVGQAPARQAALDTTLDKSVQCLTMIFQGQDHQQSKLIFQELFC